MTDSGVALCKRVTLVLLLLMLQGLSAQGLAGCQDCEEHTVLTIPRDRCVMVGDGGTGYLICTEEQIGISQYCTLSGSACYNVDVTGGGGGGTGGGGTSSGCVVGPSAVCPAQCQSCERSPFLN